LILGIFFAIFFIVLNGFFVAAEFALVKVNTTRAMDQLKGATLSERVAKDVVARLDRYLSVTQFGITLASLGLGWVGEPAIEKVMHHLVVRFIGIEGNRFIDFGATVIALSLLTFGHVLFGELVPKLIAIQKSNATALSVSVPLWATYIAFKPLLFILEKATAVILRAMGLSSDASSEGSLSEEEIIGILAASSARTPGGKEKSELIERVLRFSERTARQAMVPRVDVHFMPVDTSGEEAYANLKEMQYSRILLTRERNLDEVLGYLYGKDFIMDEALRRAPSIESLRRDVLFAPETQKLFDVLSAMRREQTHIAVVVDEYGGTSGILTMEDLLEEIVGEIQDEFDNESVQIAPVQNQEGAWDVDARVTLDELQKLGVEPMDEFPGGESIGTVVLDLFGRVPKRADRVRFARNAIAEVTSIRKRRIISLRVRLTPPEDEGKRRSNRPSTE
jgi:CBS domain containing-hemolysin-like protein